MTVCKKYIFCVECHEYTRNGGNIKMIHVLTLWFIKNCNYLWRSFKLLFRKTKHKWFSTLKYIKRSW